VGLTDILKVERSSQKSTQHVDCASEETKSITYQQTSNNGIFLPLVAAFAEKRHLA